MSIDKVKLNSPITICGKKIKNRIVVPAMTEEDGFVNENHLKRYNSYANGGAGLTIIEACLTSNIKDSRKIIGLYDDKFLQGLSMLAKKSKENNTISIVQIMLSGLYGFRENNIEEISNEKFLEYKNDFISAAVRCKKAGFDGIELHGAHGMFLNAVIESSNRSDIYGGKFENRIRILEELIREIKSSCGNEFIVAVRFGSSDLSELVKIAKYIEKAGADILDVSTGLMGYYQAPANYPHDHKVYAASLVKRNTNTPVIAVGNITTSEQAQEILDMGIADFIAVGRGHLCDPAWGNKAISNIAPNPCLHCKYCQWYVDGKRCPALSRLEK